MDYSGFKAEVYKLSGIDLNAYKEKQMLRRIDSLISRNAFTGYIDFIDELKINQRLYNDFINYLTINVSEFYRNPGQWEVLEKEILPKLLDKNKNIKIWSSAASTGDEPYTLVMVLNKFLPLDRIKILATDIDKEALAKAKTGVYAERSIKGLPKTYFDKYFQKCGEDSYRVIEDVKRCVEFKQMNLLSDKYPEALDLIVCRNVLIYFTEEAKDSIYKKFNRSLVDDGILFVGSTEQIIGSQKYDFKAIKTFFYQKSKV